ncbi:MAG: Rieske 2Fe-2S domain-containing protein [Acidimicrobiia bacterium]
MSPPPAGLLTPRRQYGPTVGIALAPLRAFLGVTFVFAGLQKLSDPNFFDAHAVSGVHQQLVAASQHSPIGGVLSTLAAHSGTVGLLIALGELAVGVGALLGLWTRAAAVGGALISLGFLLAVSWHTHPYYLGPDIVFLVAWLPLVIAGAPGPWSLDAYFLGRARRELRLAPAGRVEIEFATVRRLCGQYDEGFCRQRGGARCEPAPCPVLLATARLKPAAARELDRREFLGAARVAGLAAGAGAVLASGTAVLGRALHGPRHPAAAPRRLAGPVAPAPTTSTPAPAAAPTSSTTTAPRPPGTAVGPAASVPVGQAASFTDPYSGQPAVVVQATAQDFRCFSAVCTHAGCTVEYSGGRLVCPCHGAEFDAASGAVLAGPAARSLPAIPIALGPDGQLYVTS